MNVVESKGLSKQFRNVGAVNELSFALNGKKITGLIGPNGAGKTTLLKLMAGFLRPTAGEILVFGETPFNNLKVSSNLVFIDDNMTFPASLSIAEILSAASEFYPNWDEKFALRLFDYFELNPNQRHLGLSKGMKSTFNMIIGIAARCPLTIFDEPTTGMDTAVRKDFYRAVLNDYLQHPRTIVFSSHMLGEIENFLEDVLLLKDGSKRLHLPVEGLKEYALGLRGEADTIARFADGKEVLHRERFGGQNLYTVIENNLGDADIQAAKAAGLEVLPVSTADLCVYLTSKGKGGIDDVFQRE